MAINNLTKGKLQGGQTYDWRDLGDEGEREPNDSLTSGNTKRVVGLRVRPENRSDLTCFQSSLPTPIESRMLRFRRNRPTSMVESKMVSLISVITKLCVPLLMLKVTQVSLLGDHSLRTCGWDKPGSWEIQYIRK
jgi:hypothetical protein